MARGRVPLAVPAQVENSETATERRQEPPLRSRRHREIPRREIPFADRAPGREGHSPAPRREGRRAVGAPELETSRRNRGTGRVARRRTRRFPTYAPAGIGIETPCENFALVTVRGGEVGGWLDYAMPAADNSIIIHNHPRGTALPSRPPSRRVFASPDFATPAPTLRRAAPNQ